MKEITGELYEVSLFCIVKDNGSKKIPCHYDSGIDLLALPSAISVLPDKNTTNAEHEKFKGDSKIGLRLAIEYSFKKMAGLKTSDFERLLSHSIPAYREPRGNLEYPMDRHIEIYVSLVSVEKEDFKQGTVSVSLQNLKNASNLDPVILKALEEYNQKYEEIKD